MPRNPLLQSEEKDYSYEVRATRYQALESEPLDALIVGGGISGAPVFAALEEAGYRVGLIDRGDFASGTSQASGMLIWGGLLYLKHGDLRTVRNLSLARNRLLARQDLHPLELRYKRAYASPIPGWLMQAGLQFYWWLGQRALRAPRRLFAGTPEEALAYEEAMLNESDARLVLSFLNRPHNPHAVAQNYCDLTGACYDRGQRLWRVTLRDRHDGTERALTCRLLINAAGVWTDRLNTLCGISSPYRHVTSKGVYLNLRRWDERTHAEIHPMDGQSDVLTCVPWGPVIMWGPTETPVETLEAGFRPEREDIAFLIHNARVLKRGPLTPQEVVSIRCGVRPLAIRHGTKVQGHSLSVSRRHYLVCDAHLPAIAIYGGKLTAALDLASEVLSQVRARLPARYGSRLEPLPITETIHHPAFSQPVTSPQWARDHEQCLCLEDYLRRRTPISQWVPRMGLGMNGEHRPLLETWARIFAGSEAAARVMVATYEQQVATNHDDLLNSLL